MAGSTKNEIAHHFAARGNALCDFIDATGAMYPTLSGPTRPRREVVDGKLVHLDTGTVIGHEFLHADMESRVAVRSPAADLVGGHRRHRQARPEPR